MKRFCITTLKDKDDGARVMTYPHNSRGTHKTERGARDCLISIICNNSEAMAREYLGDLSAVRILPVDCYAGGDPKRVIFDADEFPATNTPDELANLRDEFRDCLEFVGDIAESHACAADVTLIDRAVNLQHSTPEYSLITGVSGQSISVDGGEWLPALVFVPYSTK